MTSGNALPQQLAGSPQAQRKEAVMTRRNRKVSAVLALCALLAPAGLALLAQNPKAAPAYVGGIPGATPGRVAVIGVGLGAAGALIGVGVYTVKHNHSVTGCARSGADGMTLTTESDKQTYALMGEVAGIKPGDRVRVSGKKGKEKSSGTREFLVEKVSKDVGPCEVASSSR
jgi:hypothetical protein